MGKKKKVKNKNPNFSLSDSIDIILLCQNAIKIAAHLFSVSFLAAGQ